MREDVRIRAAKQAIASRKDELFDRLFNIAILKKEELSAINIYKTISELRKELGVADQEIKNSLQYGINQWESFNKEKFPLTIDF